MKIIRLALALASLLVFQPVYADEWDDAIAAQNKGDYVTAFEGFMKLAEQGNAGAQYNLGVMYGQGRGVTQDYKEAFKWFRMAADCPVCLSAGASRERLWRSPSA